MLLARRNEALFVAVLVLAFAGVACCKDLKDVKDRSDGKPAGIPPLSTVGANSGVAVPGLGAPPSAAHVAAPSASPQGALAEADPVESPPGPNESIGGVIVLPAVNKGRVARGDTMFLTARRVGGPAGPGSMLAVQKLQADDFPMRFAISSRDAMIPGIPFEGPVSIMVRIDKDGDAMTREKGDVYGLAKNVKVGNQKVVISLDALQEQDQTLPGGPGAMPGAMPPNHP